jgi:tetratricopeptide (TPR) repeat protein
VTQIELRPLTREAADALASSLLPDGTQELAPRVAEASGGNPFFAEEVACAIAEGRGADQLPDTVQAAIATRLDLLPQAEKRTLQYAAVLGPNFLERALAELSGQSPDAALRSLVEKALVQERLAIGPGRYGFRHHLIRDVAYSSLPRVERARLHERAAKGIVDRAGERYAELAELVAYHRVQAADLDPNPERAQAACEASIESARIATRRGAAARAQELYEQAARLAGDDRGRADALGSASELALQRWRGDETIDLLREAATLADGAGDTGQAARAYARLVEVVTRMGGVSGSMPEDELQAMLDRGRELVEDDDTVTRARLQLDEAWIAWRFGRPEEMARSTEAALELARQTDDVPLLSGALDAATAVAWTEARFRDSIDIVRERLELLEGVKGGAHVGVERSDALHMMIESLVALGDFREAVGYAAQARELDLSVGTVYSGWGRGLLPAFFIGNWDGALEMADAVREAWAADERPPIHALAAALACPGAILGYRGEDADSANWFRFAESVAPAKGTGQVSGVWLLQADVDLHNGCAGEAAAKLSEPAATEMWWQTTYAATRAEALVRAGDPRGPQALAEAQASVGDHGYATGVLLRAQALAREDEGALRESLAVFQRIECPYQAARSGWMLGGADRDEAGRILGRLGATLPAD